MKQNPRYYWMAVTADKYELPIAVELSSEALAKVFGVTGSTIRACAIRGRSGRNTGRRIVRVPIAG